MGAFSILHLSDLHISSKAISGTHKKLLEDIREQISDSDKVILIITGDIINKGDYKNIDGVINFFQSLYDIL